MRGKLKIWHGLSLLLVVLLIAAYFIRLPYFVQSPGNAQSMAGLIKVNGGQKINGKYSLVYIYLGQANIYDYLWARFDGNRYTTLVKENTVMLPGQTTKEYNLIQNNYMRNAQQSAAYVAYKASGHKARVTGEGVLVLDVMPSMPSAKVLKSGDIIIGLNNQRIKTYDELDRRVKKMALGDPLRLTVLRGGKTKHVTAVIAKFPKTAASGKQAIGIGIYEDNYFKTAVSPNIHFAIRNIGGPSAGLMMALDIYDQLNAHDLAKGRAIAGTGTIDRDGEVGPIGGIEEKIVAANRSHANVFFAPEADNEYK
ncbi:MAG: SepM family pheromone-processing serine protease, partial [Sporolactobacillus sp.]